MAQFGRFSCVLRTSSGFKRTSCFNSEFYKQHRLFSALSQLQRVPRPFCSTNKLLTSNHLIFCPEFGQVCLYGNHYEKCTNLSYGDVVALLSSHDIQLIDVRDPKEVQVQGSFPDAINIPLSDIKAALKMDSDDFEKKYHARKPKRSDTNIVFVGYGSVKSTTALEIAHKLGYKKSRQYAGGFEEWNERQKAVAIA